MRWVSMVPSWTETLIECGAEVVGRTRYCIHPLGQVKEINVVGGTKDLNLEALEALKADILLLDREENPKIMSVETPVPFHATHVRTISDVSLELKDLADLSFANHAPQLAANLEKLAERWRRLEREISRGRKSVNWRRFPGVSEWLTPPPQAASGASESTQIVYVIWRSPWMCASRGTFIASMLQALGVASDQIFTPSQTTLYPSFEISDLPANSVIFLSSEPYPFVRKKQEVKLELLGEVEARGHSLALVDGESFSWFGIRSLEFLENAVFGQTDA